MLAGTSFFITKILRSPTLQSMIDRSENSVLSIPPKTYILWLRKNYISGIGLRTSLSAQLCTPTFIWSWLLDLNIGDLIVLRSYKAHCAIGIPKCTPHHTYRIIYYVRVLLFSVHIKYINKLHYINQIRDVHLENNYYRQPQIEKHLYHSVDGMR